MCWEAQQNRVTVPYVKMKYLLIITLEYPETRVARGNPAELTAKAKYML
jgi:hypothetical protein